MPPRLTISWLSPTPAPGQGGIRNIVRMARYLSAFGHDVRVYCHPCGARSDAELTAAVARHYGPSGATYRCGYQDVGPCDVLIATFWTTAPIVRSFPFARARFYFVQDYEPYFYTPGSREYGLAEQTYRLGLNHICSGPWCAQVIRERFGGRADHFRFPVDRSIYHPRPRTVRQPHVVFFARPGMARRCFPLGAEALAAVHRRLPNTLISRFGSQHVWGLGFPHRNLGMVPTLDGLADLYANADAGLAFSTTNPSLVPLEMMACGCPVVDVDNEINRATYPPGTIRLAPPTSQGVADALVALLQDSQLRERQREGGLAFTASLPSEEEAARHVESSLVAALAGG